MDLNICLEKNKKSVLLDEYNSYQYVPEILVAEFSIF